MSGAPAGTYIYLFPHYMVREFCAILKNNLADYIPTEEEIYITDNEYELVEVKYKPKKKRRAMCDLETELLDG